MSDGVADLVELGFEGLDRITGSKHYDTVYKHIPSVRRLSRGRRRDPDPAPAPAAPESYSRLREPTSDEERYVNSRNYGYRDPRASHRSLDENYYRPAPRSYSRNGPYDPADYRHNPQARQVPRGRANTIHYPHHNRPAFDPYEDDDDEYSEDELDRQRKAYTRAYVETDAFNDPDPSAPATPSEAYGSAWTRPPESRASGSYRPVPGGGLRPAAEYTPPPYPYATAAGPPALRRDLDIEHYDSVRSSGSSRRYRPRSKSPRGRGIASSVAGALAGGLLGTEVSKGDTLTTVASAVLGAISAREAERKYDKRKEEKRERRARYDDYDDDYDYDRRRRSSR